MKNKYSLQLEQIESELTELSDWLDKEVVNPATGNKVKVRSLPPEQRARYRKKVIRKLEPMKPYDTSRGQVSEGFDDEKDGLAQDARKMGKLRDVHRKIDVDSIVDTFVGDITNAKSFADVVDILSHLFKPMKKAVVGHLVMKEIEEELVGFAVNAIADKAVVHDIVTKALEV